MIKIVFFGTPDYILPILNLLHKRFRDKSTKSPIDAVVTQKPQPVGRKKVLSYSAVDKWAYDRKIPVFYSCQELIEEGIEADIGILAAYHGFVPNRLLNYYPHGILNIHPSLLPKYRSSSPVQAAIILGDKETGITVIQLDNKLDHGKIISQFKENVFLNDTTGTLRSRLFKLSAEVLVTLLPAYIEGKITLRSQDHKKATYANMIKKADAFVDPKFLQQAFEGKKSKKSWKLQFMKNYTHYYSPITIYNFIRAMQPWPIAWTNVKSSKNQPEKRLKLLKAHIENKKLVLDFVQLEGKNKVTWKQFMQGYPEAVFSKLGD